MNKIVQRLKRANGQINGLIKLIESNEDCGKTIIQFQAAKAAVDKAFSELLNEKLESCLKKKDHEDLKTILNLISKK